MNRPLLAALLVLPIFACSSGPEPGGAGGDGGASDRVAKVEVDPDGMRMVVGQEAKLEGRALDAEGNELEVSIGWTSLDPEIAFITSEGHVTALAKGMVAIRAEAQEKSTTVMIEVEGRAAVLEIPPEAQLVIGESLPLDVVLEDEDGVPLRLERIEWTYSREGVARIAEGDTLEAEGWGEVEIRASVDGLEGLLMARVLLRFDAIASGGSHACGLTPTGRAHCWGRGDGGRLGFVTEEARIPTPGDAVGGGRKFLRLAAGRAHTCALDEAGGVSCWGENDEAQLGDASRPSSADPVPVEGLPPLVDLDVQRDSSCGLAADGSWHCWGSGVAPFRVESEVAFVQLAVGDGHACGLAEDGSVHCFGSNEFGVLGSEPSQGSEAPIVVDGIPSMVGIFSGAHHVCGISKEKLAYCWGANAQGELGQGDRAATGLAGPAFGSQSFETLSLGAGLSCGITSAGAFCWGANGLGQTGSHETEDAVLKPTMVGPGPWVFQRIFAGEAHACAISRTGDTYCWGSNEWDQLGSNACDGDREPCRTSTPTLIFGQR